MLLKPFSTTSTSVVFVTGTLFHDPSSGTESREFPRFQPGFNPAKAAEAVIGVNAAVQVCEVVPLAAVLVEVWIDEVVVVCAEDVVDPAAEVLITDEELVIELLPVPGRH